MAIQDQNFECPAKVKKTLKDDFIAFVSIPHSSTSLNGYQNSQSMEIQFIFTNSSTINAVQRTDAKFVIQ